MANPQSDRFQALASTPGYQAVASLQLPDGTLVLTATDGDGNIMAVEGIDRDGRRLHAEDPLGLIRRLGQARSDALLLAAQTTDAIVNALAIRAADGEDLNLAELARESGITRQTLYVRMEGAAIAGERKRKNAAGKVPS